MLFVDIYMAYSSNAIEVAKDIKVKQAAKYKITNLAAARQFLATGIKADGEGESRLCKRASMDSVLKRFRLESAHGATTLLR